VTSEADVEAAVAGAVEALGELRLVVSCAGIGWAERTVSKRGPAQLQPFETVIRVNLIGTFNVLRFGAAAMAENEPDGGGERGAVVMTASIAAYDGQIGQTAYAASKGGIVSMTRGMARTYGPHEITVNTVSPGLVETPMLTDGLSDEVYESLKRQTPLGRVAAPHELAGTVVFLASRHAGYISGATINVSGGFLMY
jgi:NAD(P)-dependent dehydrogenase (short-subunit alcohol dehydrogenase family)